MWATISIFLMSLSPKLQFTPEFQRKKRKEKKKKKNKKKRKREKKKKTSSCDNFF